MSLILPETSTPNLHFPKGAKITPIDSDVYNICAQVKEISPRLHIHVAENNEKHKFVVMEHCDDGVDRWVMEADKLDARIVKKLQYLLHVPFEVRLAEAEKAEERMKAEQAAEQEEEMYETMGRPMWTELEKCGFVQRGVSYPKRGIKK
jgi:phenylacetate-coenzyme A ligase PaaK-like adenylate-forming protein